MWSPILYINHAASKYSNILLSASVEVQQRSEIMQFFYVFTFVLAAASARPGFYQVAPWTVPVAVPVAHQYHSQDTLGQYTYGYADGFSAKSEVRSLDGKTSGAYSYVDSDGKLQSVQYTADDTNGFQVAGTNLPIAKEEEAAKPVEDTAEVAAAKKEHLATVEATKARDADIVAKSGETDTESVEIGHSVAITPISHIVPSYYQYTPSIVPYYHYPYYNYAPALHGYSYHHLPLTYTNGHQVSDLPADEAAVAEAKKQHEKAHEEVKEKLAAAGVAI